MEVADQLSVSPSEKISENEKLIEKKLNSLLSDYSQDYYEYLKVVPEQFLCGDEDLKKFEGLQEIVKQIDLSILDSNDFEDATSLSPKRRKTSRFGSESNDIQLEKHKEDLEEATKQIELVKKALAILYDIKSTSFKRFISKNGKKCRKAVSRVIRRINDNGKAVPLWIGKYDEVPPQLCGAIEADKNYVAEIGDLVVALVKQDEKNNWILAEVIAYDPIKKEYTVDDVCEEPKKEQTISWKKVIPLPKMRADPETNPDALFPKNCFVLALYPGTTCFYRAIVGELPVKHEDPYKLLFEDENYDSGYSYPIYVHQRYVVHYKSIDVNDAE